MVKYIQLYWIFKIITIIVIIENAYHIYINNSVELGSLKSPLKIHALKMEIVSSFETLRRLYTPYHGIL
jgi:hypothetical protein